MYEYIYPDCDVKEFDFMIISFKECPHCHKLMDVNEMED
jgi:hypothetical protein